MTRKKMLKIELIAGLFSLALGGWLLHLRIHPVKNDTENVIPYVLGIISVIFLPPLFYFRKTMNLAYITNGFFVIIGTITMAHFSVKHFQGQFTLASVFLLTTFADISILWAKFVMGKALFDLEFLKTEADSVSKGRFFRYPNMGWWWAHLFALAAVYSLGNIFWK